MKRAVARLAFVCLVSTLMLGTTLAGSAVAQTKEETSGVSRSAHVIGSEKIAFAETAHGLYASAPQTVVSGGRAYLAYPAAHDVTRSIPVVYLHGAHGRADKGCPFMRSGAREIGFLVCPAGPIAEPLGVASWGADVHAQSVVVNRALEAAKENGAADELGVAVGFSQGAYVAIDIVKTGRARFRGLVLLGAEMHPDIDRLRAAGVERVAFGAGREDAAFAPLAEETKRLAAAGLETRFVDLGAIGHTYAAENTTELGDAIAWAGGSTKR